MSSGAWVMITFMICLTVIICVLAVCATVRGGHEK